MAMIVKEDLQNFVQNEVNDVIDYILDEARKFINNPETPNVFEALLKVKFGNVEALRLRRCIKRSKETPSRES
jgi:uncharacterized membrane protein YheB (UPF0754 family)